MISRRDFLQSTVGVAAAACLPASALAWDSSHLDAEEPIRWVDPRIATGGHGHCFPGAAVPFGAVQLSPDTYDDQWDWCSGYHLSDTSIMGFSHTHLSGTGCGDLLDFLVMPGVGPVKLVAGPRDNPDLGYRSRFSHDDEVVTPGYYSVLLKDPNVHAELSATERAGIHRYTFPASGDAWLILDLQHCYGGTKNVKSAELSHLAPGKLMGGRVTSAWGANRHSYFALQVSKTPERIVFYEDDVEVSAPPASLEGTNLKAVFHFKTHANETILVKTGISGVSAESAAANLHHEIPAWNFEKVRKDARELWRKQIGKIHVKSDNESHKRVFYTGPLPYVARPGTL